MNGMGCKVKTYMDAPKGEILHTAKCEISKIYKEQIRNCYSDLISSKSEISGLIIGGKSGKHFVCKITAELTSVKI